MKIIKVKVRFYGKNAPKSTYAGDPPQTPLGNLQHSQRPRTTSWIKWGPINEGALQGGEGAGRINQCAVCTCTGPHHTGGPTTRQSVHCENCENT